MISVVVGIVIQKQTILLCQRRRGGRYGLKWEFPGGKTEPGESPEQCLTREFGEELSIVPVIGPLFHRRQHRYDDGGLFDVLYYKIPSFSGTPVNRAFESFEWVNPHDLLRYDLLEGNLEVAVMLQREYDAPRS
jgi:8-oxo-dGTP diphosphatase